MNHAIRNLLRLPSLLAGLALLASSATAVSAADEIPGIDAQGYVRHWVMLAPIPLPEGPPVGDLLMRDQLPGEAKVQPKAGDRVTVGGKERVWRDVTAKTNYVDFNATLDSLNDRSGGYVVAYVESPEETPNVMVSVGSNDEARLYFNTVDIYAWTEARTLVVDGDKGKVTLRKGINVFVFKVLNELNSWQASLRLTDLAGKPLPKLRVLRTPTSPTP